MATRGRAHIIYKRDGELWIGYHNEFNGDMYPGGHYEDMLLALGTVKTYEDFGIAMHKFNKEHHNYDDFEIYHQPLNEYLELVVENNIIDLDRGYYRYWFSDYIFFLNLTGEIFTFNNKDSKNICVATDVIAAFNFAKPVGVYNRENVSESLYKV